MSKKRNPRPLGQAEGELVQVIVNDDEFWGLPEQNSADSAYPDPESTETPPEKLEPVLRVSARPPQCDSCHRLITVGPTFIHPTAPGVPLCASCYNVVDRQTRPRVTW